MTFENNQMYLFEKLEKKKISFAFIKGQSSFSKNNGVTTITDPINYDSKIPHSLVGKIISKINNKFYFFLQQLII